MAEPDRDPAATPGSDLPEPPPGQDLPEPMLRRHRPSIIWFIPLVAAVIGAWMAFKSYTEMSPTITITFQSAEGLEAGQTRIRHKEVEVGRVTAINLSPDFSRVVVTAELTREAYARLSENSRFWVVRARISSYGISGLGTLLSGAYIGLDPGPRGHKQRNFKGLETPPVLASPQTGEILELQADRLGSLNLGTPVTYRQFPVGEVAGYTLDPDGRSVLIKIHVNAPYDKLIRRDTRFWDAGGVDLSLDSGGLRLHADSLVQVLLGGIAFENPAVQESYAPPAPGRPFTLFHNRDKAFEKGFPDSQDFTLYFDESIRGLTRGAPVEYRGMRVGQVEDFRLEFDPRRLEGRLPVVVALEPDRFGLKDNRSGSLESLMDRMVRKGFRARLQTGSLLTGNRYVDLGFYPKAPARTLGHAGSYPEIPTLPSTMGSLVDSLTALSERLERLPLEDLVDQARATLPALRDTLNQIRALAARLDTETAPQVRATLAQAQATLGALERGLGPGSPAQGDLRQALEAFAQAARALRDLADTLERRPETLIFGKGGNP
jgi:paraquat-inducible protein B